MPIRLDALVKRRHQLSWSKARDWIESRKIWLDGAAVTDPGLLVDENTALDVRMNTPRAGTASMAAARLDPSRVVHADTQLIVVDKPPGLSTVPFDGGPRGETRGVTTDSLEEQVARHFGGRKVHVVHRLDRETSGLVVFGRTDEAARALAQQFRRHSVARRYFAIAQGRVASRTIRSLLVEDRGDGRRGSVDPEARGRPVSDAKEAITHVRALSFQGEATLIECELETGRTHQIRIHLSEAGHPLLGERLYVVDFGSDSMRIAAPRLMLHAAELGVEHPTHGNLMRWVNTPPPDFMNLLEPRSRILVAERLA